MTPIDIKRGYLSPKLNNWYQKVYNSISTSKMAFVGDSTSDLSGNASSILGAFTPNSGSPYVDLGDIMNGFNVSNLPNFGNNGATLSSWLSAPTGTYGLNNLVAANPDLIIFSYGINDTRTNTVTKDQLKALVITAINNIRAALPNTDIILRMPNSFKIPATNLYIQQGSYSSLAVAAQAQTDILYQAYKELDNYWPNVYLFNSQDLVFGRVCKTTSNLMTDDIHPQYAPIIAKMIDIIYPKTLTPFSKDVSNNAIAQSFSTPWTIYNRACENTDYYTLIASGRYNTQGANYIDISCDDAYTFSSSFRRGDIINFCDSLFLDTNIVANVVQAMSVQDATHVRILFSSTTPSNTIVNGAIKIYRSEYNSDSNTRAYINNRQLYKYLRNCSVAGYTNYLDVSAADNTFAFGVTKKYGASNVLAGYWQLLAANILLVPGQAPLTLTGAQFFVLNDTTIRIILTGNWSAYQNNAIIAGIQSYEDYNTNKFAQNVLWGPTSITPVLGRLGLKNGGLKAMTSEGEAAYGGLVYLDTSEPAGNTITNTTTKTYFASQAPFAANVLTQDQHLKADLEFAVSTSAAAGTVVITIEIGGSTILLTSGAIVLPSSLTTALAKLSIDIFLKSISAGTYATVGGYAVFDIVGVIVSPIFRVTDLSGGGGINVTGSNTLKVSVTHNVASVNNIILLKTFKLLSFKQ